MKKLLPIFIFVFLFVGGIGVEKVLVEILGLFASLIFLVYTFYKNRKLFLPKGVFSYLAFLSFAAASFLWSIDRANTLEYLLLFATGGILWVTFFNIKKIEELSLDKVFVAAGLAFSFSYLYHLYTGAGRGTFSLVFPSSSYHHHLGDYWAAILPITAVALMRKSSVYKKLFIVLFGLLFVALSQSRSAHIALVAALTYIFLVAKKLKKRYLYSLLAIVAAFFVVTGFSKPTLLARPYFFQGALGLINEPLGAGIGNFGEISADPRNHIWNMDSYTSIAHNIVFEVTAGIGILGIIFIYWLASKIKDLMRKRSNLAYKASFFALTTNFLFDSTYFIPTMIWLWFILLGISEKRN